MVEIREEVKWGVLKRLEFIEFRLFWNGRVNRSDLSDKFGLSHQQASTDLKTYQELAAENLAYDNAEKAYLRSKSFRPVLLEQSADRYLLQVLAIKSGWMRREDTWFDELPPLHVVGLAPTKLAPEVVLAVTDAIRDGSMLEIVYRSMTGSPEASRSVAPHAVFHSAGRWYIRAWSRTHDDFRDYNLARIQDASVRPEVFERQALDYEWAQKINLRIGPNPDLPDERKMAVMTEHAMTDGVMEVPVRLSLSFYLMSENNLDVEPKVLPPAKQQLVLLNRKDVDDARRLARQMSKEALARGEP